MEESGTNNDATALQAENWTLWKVYQKHLGGFESVFLENDGDDQLGRSCEK